MPLDIRIIKIIVTVLFIQVKNKKAHKSVNNIANQNQI